MPAIAVGDAITAESNGAAALYHEEAIVLVGTATDAHGRAWFLAASASDDDYFDDRNFAIRADHLESLVAAGEMAHHKLADW